MHNRAQIRAARIRYINRRKRIVEDVYNSDVSTWGGLGALSKNKVHCSCPICSEKTRIHSSDIKNTHGFRKNWKHSDKKKLLRGV